MSVLTLAQPYIGEVSEPSDLSTNKKYMDEYGSKVRQRVLLDTGPLVAANAYRRDKFRAHS